MRWIAIAVLVGVVYFFRKRKPPTSTAQAIGGELVVCPRCVEENVAGARFCYKCGKKLD